ncbi:MAG: FtsW/RodA/SpoVE family cell cycle protein [Chloroflexi bacterium]|nr:MAG: FtsW/RodA/SpoVE family cell cycle protein [Chloroflexota bacterium]
MQQEQAKKPKPLKWFYLTSSVFLFTNTLSLSLQGDEAIFTRYWLPLLAWLSCVMVAYYFTRRRLTNYDPLLLAIPMFLSGWGLIVIARLEPPFALRQALWMVLATAAMLFFATTPYVLQWLRRYRYILLVGGLGLLLSTILLGQNPSQQPGAPQLWLNLGGVYFQPSEALKIILVGFLASYLSEQATILRHERLGKRGQLLALSPRIAGPVLLMWGISIVILIWQRDLGTATLFFIVFLILLYVASGMSWILFGGAILVILAGIIAYFAFDVVQTRVDIWLNPWPEADGRAYQIVQSLMAFASGSIFGQGIYQGAPTYIPVIHSDFIFAAIAEEWGLLGVLVTLGAFALLTIRGLRVAILLQKRPFYSLLATGLSLLLGIQSLLIMGGVLKIVPLTGVTLPFLSYGGSSLLASFIMIGLLLRISTELDTLR